jgi:GDPmannose 4,6-dehydratase
MNKKALILGITGQDGSYLAELLLRKGYEVHGFIRRSATGNTKNIDHILNEIQIHRGDLADATSIYRVINEVKPNEIYNEADQDHVSWSYSSVDYSCDITGAAVARILEIIKQINPAIKFFQPLSSNIFGKAIESPQNEKTAFNPQSPYAAAKVFAYVLCKYYREVFDIKVSTAIFYNHESERRTEDYVTRKITRSVAKISLGLQDQLFLGNLDTKIDFGYAPDYMEAAWNIMQLDCADDFIIGTGEVHTVQEFLHEAFEIVGLNPENYVKFDPQFARPSDTRLLIGDISKAKKAFGFRPQVTFKKLVKLMVENDIAELKQ